MTDCWIKVPFLGMKNSRALKIYGLWKSKKEFPLEHFKSEMVKPCTFFLNQTVPWRVGWGGHLRGKRGP